MWRYLKIAALSLSLFAAFVPSAQAAETEYLFGLTADEIIRVMDNYVGARNYNREEALARMAQPFNCRYFDELCSEIGADYTYYALEEVWNMGRLGIDSKTIAAELEALLPRLSLDYIESRFPNGLDPRELYFGVPDDTQVEECTAKVVFKDSGVFRLRVTSRKADFVLISTPFGQSEFFKQNSRGKYRAERADHINIDSTHFFTTDDIPNVEHKTKDGFDDKQVTVFFGGGDVGNAIQDVHVESCGFVEDAVFLFVCSCTGPRPEIYEGL